MTLWDVTTGTTELTVGGGGVGASVLVFSENGYLAAVCGVAGDAAQSTQLLDLRHQSFTKSIDGAAAAAAFDASGKYISCATDAGLTASCGKEWKGNSCDVYVCLVCVGVLYNIPHTSPTHTTLPPACPCDTRDTAPMSWPHSQCCACCGIRRTRGLRMGAQRHGHPQHFQDWCGHLLYFLSAACRGALCSLKSFLTHLKGTSISA